MKKFTIKNIIVSTLLALSLVSMPVLAQDNTTIPSFNESTQINYTGMNLTLHNTTIHFESLEELQNSIFEFGGEKYIFTFVVEPHTGEYYRHEAIRVSDGMLMWFVSK